MPAPLVDASVLVRHFTGDHAGMSPRASALIVRVLAGDLVVRLTDPVVFETGFTLERSYKIPKPAIRDALMNLVASEHVELTQKERWLDVLELYATTALSIVDAWHVLMMRESGIDVVYAFDRDFDRVPGLTRIEP